MKDIDHRVNEILTPPAPERKKGYRDHLSDARTAMRLAATSSERFRDMGSANKACLRVIQALDEMIGR